jgi:hypothetical protein
MYQRTQDGDTKLLTNTYGNIFNETVLVTAIPSGNNQMAPLLSPPSIVVLPKDTKKIIGNNLVASTDGSTSTVTVLKNQHGLLTGELVTILATNAIGGISSTDLSVTNVACIVIDLNTFSYTAAAASTSVASGSLDKVKAISIRSYTVGNDELDIYVNGQHQTIGVDYDENGLPGTASNSINWLRTLVNTDRVLYRIAANGGQYIVNAGGSNGSLQLAYNGGSTINIATGSPITISGTGKLMHIAGDMQVDGVIDPDGITFTPMASNPLTITQYGLWTNTAGDLVYNRAALPSQNISSVITDLLAGNLPALATSSPFNNASGSSIAAYTPVSIDASGQLQAIDVSSEAASFALAGVTTGSIANGTSGNVVTSGILSNITTSYSLGDVLFVINKFKHFTGNYPIFSVPVSLFLENSSYNYILWVRKVRINYT